VSGDFLLNCGFSNGSLDFLYIEMITQHQFRSNLLEYLFAGLEILGGSRLNITTHTVFVDVLIHKPLVCIPNRDDLLDFFYRIFMLTLDGYTHFQFVVPYHHSGKKTWTSLTSNFKKSPRM